MPEPKLTVPQYLTFASTLKGLVEGPLFDREDERNAATLATYERMQAEGAFGTRDQRRAWARACRKQGGI